SNIGSEYQQMDSKEVEALGSFCKYLEADPHGQNAGYATAQAKTLYIKLGGVSDVKDEDVCKPIVKPTPVAPPPDTHPTPPVDNTAPTPLPTTPVDQGPTTKTPAMRFVGIGLA